MTATELRGAAEVLARLAEHLHRPNAKGRVQIMFDKTYFSALQLLLRGTEWEGRFCWQFGDGALHVLSVDVKPLPRKITCRTCKGTGFEFEVLPQE